MTLLQLHVLSSLEWEDNCVNDVERSGHCQF